MSKPEVRNDCPNNANLIQLVAALGLKGGALSGGVIASFMLLEAPAEYQAALIIAGSMIVMEGVGAFKAWLMRPPCSNRHPTLLEAGK